MLTSIYLFPVQRSYFQPINLLKNINKNRIKIHTGISHRYFLEELGKNSTLNDT
jgi:hypothetical protein